MRSANTVGFAIEDADRPRLDHLALVFGGGNRSQFLRVAMSFMERLEAVEALGRVQAYGASRLGDAGRDIAEIPEIVAKALANPGPESIAQAKLVVADITRRWTRPRQEPAEVDEKLRAAFSEALTEI